MTSSKNFSSSITRAHQNTSTSGDTNEKKIRQPGLIHKLLTIAASNTSISYHHDILASRHAHEHSDDPARGARTHTIFSLSKSTPSGSGGVLSFISSKTFTTRSATTRFRYHLWFAGTMYQGAHSVL